ncbi:basic amino acid ABC transporter substrate-binding protein [Collimonas sp. OK412]|jgi:polar amino acid transport system substrate-binding protein|uniref:basic amino acid ABC transporter substrate-binding protein n=1 Tax=Collimonas sp. (strain OK412) TaxID=1801619 RepID=UPI0008F190BE|nr:basic amino acid ABC transporter substrate-binding protein [Collimonas sp. OK412]SFD33426.1 polar amino acid transport system substrate-binding protein [Collimonas sp. OK412]
MKKMLSRYLPLCALSLGLLAVGACSKKEEAPAAAAKQTLYVVGVESAYAPFSAENEKKEVVGFDIDLMKAIAAKIGIEVKFIPTPFEGIFNFLAQGDRDLLISAITITDERKQTVDFSDPYFEASQLIAVPQGNTSVKQFTDLKTMKIGVQSATTGDEVVQNLVGKNNPSIKRFDSTTLALKELESGGVDAVVADDPVVRNYITNNPSASFRVVPDAGFPKEYYGIAVRKGNTELLAKINQGLADVKADGSFAKINEKYFGNGKQ